MLIKAAILDMDGLMFDSERIAQAAWQKAAEAYGFELTPEINFGVIGKALPDVEIYLRSIFGADFHFLKVYQAKQANVDEHIHLHGLPFKPGLEELLAYLEMRQIPKAIASSSGKAIIRRNLSLSGLDVDRFAALVSGDDVSRGKPDPDIFVTAASQLDVPAEQCLVLEDSEAGLRAAWAAGMLPVCVPDLVQPSNEIREVCVGVFSDLLAVVDWMKSL